MPRYDADWIDSMLQPERRGSPTADATLQLLKVRPGDLIADVGCGPGFFTLPAARLVAPGGMVYAVDREPSMLQVVQSRAAQDNVEGIATFQVTGDQLPLDDDVADLSLCALVLHDLEDRLPLINELIRVTKPTGRIAVVEWTVEDDDQRWNRLRPEQTARLFAEAGRAKVDVSPLGTRQYLLVAR